MKNYILLLNDYDYYEHVSFHWCFTTLDSAYKKLKRIIRWSFYDWDQDIEVWEDDKLVETISFEIKRWKILWLNLDKKH